MKATLTFNLPEDRTSFNAAAKADDMASALWDIVFNQRKRAFDTYIEGNKKYSPVEIINGIFDTISDTLDGHGIMIDDLTE